MPTGRRSWEAQRPIITMVLKAVTVMMVMVMAVSPESAPYHGHCLIQTLPVSPLSRLLTLSWLVPLPSTFSSERN